MTGSGKSLKPLLFIAALVSLGVGIAASMTASSVLPCYSDRAGCGMAEALRVFVVPLYVFAVFIVLAIAAARNSRHALTLTMCGLCVAGCVWLLLGVFSEPATSRFRSFVEGSQLLIPYLAVVVSQWLVIRYGAEKAA